MTAVKRPIVRMLLVLLFVCSAGVPCMAATGDVISSFAAPGAAPYGLAWDGTNLWHADKNSGFIYELTTTGSVLSSFAQPGSKAHGLTWDGTNLWLVDDNTDLVYELTTTGTVLSSFATPGPSPAGLTWDGTNLWLADSANNLIYQLTTTGTVLSSFATPSNKSTGLTWDGTNLWLGDEIGLIYELTTAGTIVSSFSTPGANPSGLTFDGTYFWHADDDAVDLIYQLEGPANSCPTVTNTNDAGPGSLRACIDYANSNPGTTITFNIPLPANQSSGGDSWWRISPGSALPAVTANGTIIDGTTQTTNQGNTNSQGPEIEVSGAGAGAGVDGLLISSSGNTLRGMVINSFNGNGINLISGGGNSIEGNYIGTDATGTVDLGNGDVSGSAGGGIWISSDNNVIGGTTAAERNLISGNNNEGINVQGGTPTGNLIQGNFIGTDVTGTIALPNFDDGIALRSGASNNTIGGSAAGAGNLISGNGGEGIHLIGSGNFIQGNIIGADVTGVLDLGNAVNGIWLEAGATANTIGGAGGGEANNIAFNGGDGVSLIGIGTDDNLISANSIFENGGLGIDLAPDGVGVGGGANNDKPAPTLNPVKTSGSDFLVDAVVTSGDTIEFFRANNTAAPAVNPDVSGSGEGYLYLGSCVDNGACSGPYISAVPDADPSNGAVVATILSTGLSAGDTLTATASDAVNGTSEFSGNVVVTNLAIVKQVWEENGTAPMVSPVSAPVGSTLVFLIYVKNTLGVQVTDVRINDDLDEAGFAYIAGSLVRTDAVTPPADTATDLQIFNATAPGTGTPVSDGVDGDVSSAQDTGGLPDLDRVTIGAVTGQPNGLLAINGNTTFALRFRVRVK